MLNRTVPICNLRILRILRIGFVWRGAFSSAVSPGAKSGPALRELGRIAARRADLKSGPGLRGNVAQPARAALDPTRIVNQRCPATLRGPARSCSSFNAHWASRLGSVGCRGLPASHAPRRCCSPLLGHSRPACGRQVPCWTFDIRRSLSYLATGYWPQRLCLLPSDPQSAIRIPQSSDCTKWRTRLRTRHERFYAPMREYEQK